MRKSFLKAFGYFVCLVWSSTTYAVGFGGINVTSALGQPLVAEIELVAVEAADKSTLNARLASPEAFKGAGIDFPYGLPKLKFSVETRANGDAYIKATSTQPINEPFVSLLIELGWSSGRLLREYTFLLDPPGFMAEQKEVAAVQPIEPVVVPPVIAVVPQVEAVPEPVAPAAEVAPAPEVTPDVAQPAAAESTETAAEAAPAQAPVATPEPTPAPAEAKEEPPFVRSPAKQKVETTPASAASITVKRGDTLGKIAAKTKASDVSLERMLVALYRANAEAFEGKNMNRLSAGKILRMPEPEALAALQQAEAANEVRAQVVDWNAYRQKLAAATGAAKEQRPKQEVAGKITTTLTDKAPEAKEPAKEVLKLSKGDAPGDKAATGGKADKAMAKGEDAIAKAKALKEAEQRTAMLEKSVKDMQRLVELKNQAAAAQAEQGKSAVSAPASALPLVASTVMPASSVAVASEVVAAKPKVIAPKVVAPPPSMMDDILANPIYLGGAAAVLLGLGGLVFMRLRGKKEAKPVVAAKEEDIGSASSRIAAPIAPSPETGDFTNASAAPASVIGDAEEVDPIGEADLFLNFGRDVQAEEVLKEALKKDPSNNPVKLKLLSIYASRKDTKSFYVYALEVKESGDAASWEKAAEMGRALEPNNSMYGGAGEPVAVATDSSSPQVVDFDLGFGDTATAEPAAMDIGSVEPESNSAESTVIMTATELRAAQEAPMDFDITGTHPGIQAAVEEEPEAVADVSAMDFDLTVAPPAANLVAEEPKLDMPAMDFDLSALDSTAPADASSVAEDKSPSMNLDDLVFDVTSSHVAAPVAAVESAPVSDVDQGMAFTLDIPTETKSEEAAKPAAKDVGLSEISLNLDEPVVEPVSPSSEPKSEQWQEVATKLDLAKAYQEMGDQDGAREILEEVVRDGDEQQREAAEALLQQLL